MTGAPADHEFLSGQRGSPGRFGLRALRRARDRVLDARLRAERVTRRLDELAAAVPPRAVTVVSIYRPGGGDLPAALSELRRTRHGLSIALGTTGEPAPELAGATVARDLDGGKFENVGAVVAAAGAGADWTLVVDDDVELPAHFLDRFLGVCERLDLALAQPAQSLASFAAWPLTRRRARSLARETRFVEIGPVTAFRRDALAALTPFPPLRYGWGLDLHWGAVAAERGLRMGIVDALPVRHERSAVAVGYPARDAIDEAREFLTGRAFVDSRRAAEAIRTHPLP